jgi:hypothetical protein
MYLCPGAGTTIYVKIRVFWDVTLVLDVSKACSVVIFRAKQEMSSSSGQIDIDMDQVRVLYWLGGACTMQINCCGCLALKMEAVRFFET